MTLVRATLCLVIAGAALGCSRSEAAPAPAPAGTRAAAVSSEAAHDTPNYKVTIAPSGPYQKGKEGMVRVVIVTKGKYHINDQYPYKFVVQDPPAEGMTYTNKTVRRADGKFEETRAELPVRFTPQRSGTVQVGGILSLSVCTPSNCLLDKRPLVLDIEVP